jgi:hypothetical protein
VSVTEGDRRWKIDDRFEGDERAGNRLPTGVRVFNDDSGYRSELNVDSGIALPAELRCRARLDIAP